MLPTEINHDATMNNSHRVLSQDDAVVKQSNKNKLGKWYMPVSKWGHKVEQAVEESEKSAQIGSKLIYL